MTMKEKDVCTLQIKLDYVIALIQVDTKTYLLCTENKLLFSVLNMPLSIMHELQQKYCNVKILELSSLQIKSF